MEAVVHAGLPLGPRDAGISPAFQRGSAPTQRSRGVTPPPAVTGVAASVTRITLMTRAAVPTTPSTCLLPFELESHRPLVFVSVHVHIKSLTGRVQDFIFLAWNEKDKIIQEVHVAFAFPEHSPRVPQEPSRRGCFRGALRVIPAWRAVGGPAGELTARLLGPGSRC
ncbi:hypothetical protein SKAU_G00127240 [Synaphobranchus kaupii]|uniref:Uncharacterized protein n=1 Tax=Synaphobranchus kaupii TaxID=118154 RepID=A0A9Q1FQN9_SYNKA|nr:hypothetical protein SKAU_G00127240 [Synaphobranchus kaupii]